jgi:hypothetical protein
MRAKRASTISTSACVSRSFLCHIFPELMQLLGRIYIPELPEEAPMQHRQQLKRVNKLIRTPLKMFRTLCTAPLAIAALKMPLAQFKTMSQDLPDLGPHHIPQRVQSVQRLQY